MVGWILRATRANSKVLSKENSRESIYNVRSSEVEVAINSRPLAYVSDDDALSPNA